MLWNASESAAAMKAKAIETLVAATVISWGDDVLSVGASVGVAVLGEADSPADALAHADRAMYARKAARRSARPQPKQARDQTPRRATR
jgi:GGDEF domain-containing protein